jgi:hypothetical protein
MTSTGSVVMATVSNDIMFVMAYLIALMAGMNSIIVVSAVSILIKGFYTVCTCRACENGMHACSCYSKHNTKYRD